MLISVPDISTHRQRTKRQHRKDVLDAPQVCFDNLRKIPICEGPFVLCVEFELEPGEYYVFCGSQAPH